MKLNLGIAYTVQWLNERGFVTTDSGDGKTRDFECDPGIPYVHIRCKPSELYSEVQRLKDRLLAEWEIEVEPMNETNSLPTIQGSLDAATDDGFISMWNIMLAPMDLSDVPSELMF